jgi:toxin ParE1/3/4
MTASAEEDARQIHAHIAGDKPAAADKWLDQVERQVQSLETMPRRHEVIPEADELGVEYRHIVFGNYRTIYRIDGRRVIILRVLHAARLLDQSLLSEL